MSYYPQCIGRGQRPNVEASLPNLIAAINGDRPALLKPKNAAELAEIITRNPADRCKVEDRLIFGATADEVFPFFVRIVLNSGAYEVRLEWFAGYVPTVVKLWDTAAAGILAHPHVKAVMHRNGWTTDQTEPNVESLQLHDGKGGFFGDPHVHFTNGNLFVWWQINAPGVLPKFFNA